MRNGIRFGPAIAVTFLCATAFSATIAPLHAQAVTNANSTKSTTTANNINPEHESTFEEACQCVRHRNFKDAHHKLNSLADNQHAKALTLQGLLYERGLGVPKDAQKAADCYRKAAAKGLPEAESRLGHLLLETENTAVKDTKAATVWLEKSAQHGVSEAQATLGKLYYEGNHLPIKNSEAVRWLRQAADQGNFEAKEMLERVPVLKQTNERIQTAQAQYGAGLGNLEKSWKGYIDIVNSVNEAAAYKPR